MRVFMTGGEAIVTGNRFIRAGTLNSVLNGYYRHAISRVIIVIFIFRFSFVSFLPSSSGSRCLLGIIFIRLSAQFRVIFEDKFMDASRTFGSSEHEIS